MDKSAPQALYRQAKAFVQGKMASGEWKPGDLIPSENRLVVELRMSRMTVNRALRELTESPPPSRNPICCASPTSPTRSSPVATAIDARCCN
jgi:DNA-binding transcriptional MocR family regulator